MSSKQNHTWNIVLVVLTLILITLITLHIRQRQRAAIPPPSPVVAETFPVEVVPPAPEDANLIHVTPENMAEIESLNLAMRPAVVPGALDAQVDKKQALQRQTRDLLDEARSQDNLVAEDRRALALTKEEVLQLEKEGRMAY